MNWDQLKSILWLRWRLTRNQWRRTHGIGAVITAIVSVSLCAVGGAGFIGALVGGIIGLGHAKPVIVWAVWLGLTVGFLILWTLGMLQELQRSETIDLQRLMHLPVALGQVFTVNYIASHLAASIVILLPPMIGLAIGLSISRGPAMLLLIPLAFGMVFMITAWTYCLRGWLAALMSNPRKRRTVTMLLGIAFVLLVQGPNLYFNVLPNLKGGAARGASQKNRHSGDAQKTAMEQRRDQLIAIQKFIPPLWLPLGAQALAEGRALPALLGALGCVAIGALGLRRAYRGTLRFYRGETGEKFTPQVKPKSFAPGVTAAAPGSAKTANSFLELRIPAVPEQAAALALATLRSLLRAPEVKIAWGTSFLVTLIAGGSLMFRSALKIPEIAKPFIATGVVVFSVFMLVQFFGNQFGFDHDGFRALVLSPVERRWILLGKNLACLPVGAGFGVTLLALVSVWLRLPALMVIAAMLQLAALLFLAALVGNALSILVPYRIQPGTMKPTKLPGLATFVLMLCHMIFPAAMTPIFVPALAEILWRKAGWPNAAPVNLILSFALAGSLALAYRHSLAPMGRLLQRRETKILGVVTVEVE